MAQFLGFSGPIVRKRAGSPTASWRREALWHQTLFLLGFDPADRLTLSSAGIAVLDPDLEQGGNTNIVVRRDPATGEMTRVLVHRWCRPGRSPRSTSDALADA